ncbi:MAG TPA: AAA family ATPase [Clostridia bacterium]|nr:AAA family ATPase [Clostridia bacterium]
MLSQLHIENVAVIENADLNLKRGLNVLTGETGAGKSILIDSINLALGERVTKDIVRTGSRKALVGALFTEISEEAEKLVRELGMECEEDGSLLIQREISADGRGSCRISGRPATVSMLREIGRKLVNIHGQHDNQALLSPDKHIFYLDRFSQTHELLSRYEEAYRRVKQIERELSGILTDETARVRRIELLSYQINEIESAELKPGEEEDLAAQKTVIVNAEKITQSVNRAYTLLSGDNETAENTDSAERGARELVSTAGECLAAAAEYNTDYKSLAQRITDLSYEIEDCVSELRSGMNETEYNQEDLDWIEQRLDMIYRLKLKYGGSVPEIMSYLENAKKELDGMESSDEKAQKLKKMLDQEKNKLTENAGALSRARHHACKSMERGVKSELEFLDMPRR